MTNQERKSCKLACKGVQRGQEGAFWHYGAVAYDYSDPRIVHMGKEGVKAGLVRLPREQSFSMYIGKVLLVIPVASFCTQTRQVGILDLPVWSAHRRRPLHVHRQCGAGRASSLLLWPLQTGRCKMYLYLRYVFVYY